MSGNWGYLIKRPSGRQGVNSVLGTSSEGFVDLMGSYLSHITSLTNRGILTFLDPLLSQ